MSSYDLERKLLKHNSLHFIEILCCKFHLDDLKTVGGIIILSTHRQTAIPAADSSSPAYFYIKIGVIISINLACMYNFGIKEDKYARKCQFLDSYGS